MRRILPCIGLVLMLASCGDDSSTSGGVVPAADGGGSDHDSGNVIFDGGGQKTDGDSAAVDTGIVCQHPGPITIPGTDRCAGDLARATFLFAICSCTDIDTSSSGFSVGAFDSTTQTKLHTGSVGANGKFVGGSGSIDGPLWAGGIGVTTQPVVTATNMTMTRDVVCGGDLTTSGILGIEGDAYVTGAVLGGTGILSIDGVLHQPASSPPPQGVTPKGGIVTEPVTVGEPCNCSNPLDIASIVAPVKDDNDDAVVSLTPSSLTNFGNLSLAIGCGRYYFDAITGGNLSLTVAGPTAIFVAGDFDAVASINVLPGSQLDLFVAGNLHLSGAWQLGSSDAPANTRVYVGGTSLTLDGAFAFNANLYAPKADVSIKNSAFGIKGALLARRIEILGVAGNVTYDQAVQELTGCQPSGGGCKSCHDCGGTTPACKGGACVACTSNADCCPPQACIPDGRCVTVVK
ncbi:MAG: hypothetical protein HY898_09295 [Deltaproteobacteria bacterium]|nr:hypothetical protein [Deltaproteobacteria bacterium]